MDSLEFSALLKEYSDLGALLGNHAGSLKGEDYKKTRRRYTELQAIIQREFDST